MASEESPLPPPPWGRNSEHEKMKINHREKSNKGI